MSHDGEPLCVRRQPGWGGATNANEELEQWFPRRGGAVAASVDAVERRELSAGTPQRSGVPGPIRVGGGGGSGEASVGDRVVVELGRPEVPVRAGRDPGRAGWNVVRGDDAGRRDARPSWDVEFVAGWLDRYALRVRPSTLARVRQIPPHLEVFARVAVDEIDPAAVEDHIAALARRAPRQAELALRVLKQMLANAKERGHVVDEGVFRLKAPRRDQPEMRFLGWDEVEELAANTFAPHGNLVLIAALTGLRQGERFALRDRNLDLEAMTIQVEYGAYRGELVPVKTRASRRRADLSSTAAHVLRRQILARKANERGLVFPSPRGALLNDDNFRHRVFTPAGAAPG